MPRREVKHEWNPAYEYSLLIAVQVIHVVVHARIRSMSFILGIGLLLLLLLWQTDIHATHWIAPTSSSCERCLDSWQARDVRQPMLVLGASGWVALVLEAGLRTVSSCIASTSPLVP